jgi:hypothetical protein
MIVCCGFVLFGSSLFGVLEASCTWMSIVFSRFGNFLLLFCKIYYKFLLFASILFLQCPWFSGLVYWWSRWIPACSFHRSWVVW